MEKLNRAAKCSILGPQNLGSGGVPGPRGPPLDPRLFLGKDHTSRVNMTELPQYRSTEEILDLCLSLSHGFSSFMKNLEECYISG